MRIFVVGNVDGPLQPKGAYQARIKEAFSDAEVVIVEDMGRILEEVIAGRTPHMLMIDGDEFARIWPSAMHMHDQMTLILDECPKAVKVLFATSDKSLDSSRDLINTGAMGIIVKGHDDVAEAIEALMSDRAFLSTALAPPPL